MADKIRMTIKGDKELLKKLIALGDGVEQVLEDAATAGAEVIADQANKDAPGPHIEVEATEKSRTSATVEIGPDEDHWYYRFFETGVAAHPITPKTAGGLAFMGREGEKVLQYVWHIGMPAQPFLRPAMDEEKQSAVDATGAQFKQEIDKQVE